jgi:hypothetical protein
MSLWTLAMIAATATAVPLPGPAAIPTAAPIQAAAGVATTDGSFHVALTLTTSLTGLQPAVAKGVWVCSARTMPLQAIAAEIAKIAGLTGRAARTEFATALEYRAHYLGQQSSVEFAVADGAYRGSPSVDIKVTGADLADPATRRVIANPGVMVGCWLRLLNAAGQGDFAYQAPPAPASAAAAAAMLRISAAPYFLGSASVRSQ